MHKKLVILSGPSCVGKTPLLKALAAVHPELAFHMPILYSSRKPRPIEKEGVDYFFRSEEWIRSLPADDYIVAQTRTVWQAVELAALRVAFQQHRIILAEIYPTLAQRVRQFVEEKGLLKEFRLHMVFISPATEAEIIAVQQGMGFKSPAEATAAIMLPKLISRSQQQGKLITPAEWQDLHTRASRAWDEIQMAAQYTDVLINHDGEDSHHWKLTPPIGDAGATLQRLAAILAE